MKALFKALILIAAAGGFCIALSMSAQADVVEPTSAYQPASTVLLDKEAAADLPSGAQAEAPKPLDTVVEPEAAVIEQPEVAATPAPEQQVVRQVPTAVVPNFARGTDARRSCRASVAYRCGTPEDVPRTGGQRLRGRRSGREPEVRSSSWPCSSMAIPFIRRRVIDDPVGHRRGRP